MADVQTGHPGPERLAAFRLGRLPSAERAATEAHLAGCDACRRQLSSLSDATVLSVMRQPVGATEAPQGPAPRPAGPRPPDGPAELANHPRYRVLQLLGRGGMGAVYKAEHRLMQRLVALKVIDRGLTGDPAAVERFRREVIAAARLTHPNIVTALDAEQVGNLHFLVMEYVEGTNLAALVARRGGLPVLQACNYAAQAAAGCAEGHQPGTDGKQRRRRALPPRGDRRRTAHPPQHRHGARRRAGRRPALPGDGAGRGHEPERATRAPRPAVGAGRL